MTISTRPELPEDEPFLRRLIFDTIARQLHAELWPAEIRESVLGLQYKIRREGSLAACPGAASEIIVADGEPAGWLVVAELPEEVRLAEIMVSAERRGTGVGSGAIREVMARGERAGKPVRLNVSVSNPRAQQLYRRLGFRRIHDGDAAGDEVNVTMEYRNAAWITD